MTAYILNICIKLVRSVRIAFGYIAFGYGCVFEDSRLLKGIADVRVKVKKSCAVVILERKEEMCIVSECTI